MGVSSHILIAEAGACFFPFSRSSARVFYEATINFCKVCRFYQEFQGCFPQLQIRNCDNEMLFLQGKREKWHWRTYRSLLEIIGWQARLAHRTILKNAACPLPPTLPLPFVISRRPSSSAIRFISEPGPPVSVRLSA